MSGRLHVVLVPGFAGFDALGQLEYYSGITPLFRRWSAAHPEAGAVLHYFDNLPTAGVDTRAARLRGYLAKRVARGELQGADRLALVGHSTGGLDVRRAIWDLAQLQEPIAVDGPRGEAFTVQPSAILDLLRRVAFLSVPQYGTNLADWIRAHPVERALAVTGLRAIVRAAAGVPAADMFQGWVTGFAAALAGADILLAMQDALTEIEVGANDEPARIASAHEASAQLALWLRHLSSDFSAVNDLATKAPPRSRSPAHFSAAAREREREIWTRFGVQTRSWATVGARPFRFEEGRPAPRWDRTKPWTWPELSAHDDAAVRMDIAYRWTYRACAGGPFAYAGAAPPALAPLGGGRPAALELWDNDGIVNTASMLWPDGADTVLVRGDHADVIGHYRTIAARPGLGRKYQAYDLLGSASGFDAAALELVWNGVLDFCAS